MGEGSERRIINAVAPIRICDLGGWTDTWFAERGAVMNFGVYPYAEVQIYVSERQGDGRGRISIHVENFGERYTLEQGAIEYDRHPLIEAAIDIMELPEHLSFDINLYSEAPAGCSTGTSASVTGSRRRSWACNAAFRTSSPRPTVAAASSRCFTIRTRPYLSCTCRTPCGGNSRSVCC